MCEVCCICEFLYMKALVSCGNPPWSPRDGLGGVAFAGHSDTHTTCTHTSVAEFSLVCKSHTIGKNLGNVEKCKEENTGHLCSVHLRAWTGGVLSRPLLCG